MVAHDKDGRLLLVNSPSSDMLSLVPAHLLELENASGVILDFALKQFKFSNRLDYWLKNPPGQAYISEGDGAGVSHTQANSLRCRLGMMCQLPSERLLFRKSVKPCEAHFSMKHERKWKLHYTATWLKLWKRNNDDAVNTSSASNDLLTRFISSSKPEPEAHKRDAWKLRLTSLFEGKRDLIALF